MCGRYHLDSEESNVEMRAILEEIDRRFAGTKERAAMKLGEIFPTNIVPVLLPERERAVPALMKWGFTRHDGKGQLINARSETALERPTFRKAMLERRCLIPAQSYYEWEKRGKQRIKYALRPGGSGLLYMAGLYRLEAGAPLPQFVILTRAAAPSIAFIHDRMPVVLPESAQRAWLDASAGPGPVLEMAVLEMAYQAVS